MRKARQRPPRRHFPAVVASAILLAALAGPDPIPGAATGSSLDGDLLAGLELRPLGPAVMGGRIADVVVDPRRRSTWYVAAGSGGVWKTTDAGTTWTPIFDDQPAYSIGALALDPRNPDVVWVGTGENVSGRHVGWGYGVFRSRDGGATWERMGLESSEHVGRIAVDPRDGDVVWVAAEGPLWSSGGERGVYVTRDGGATWERSLGIDEETGATDVALDPRDPDVVWAVTYQRRRHVWGLLAGGPGSGIWKSTDGGESWRRLERGLPGGPMGKIGLALSPADPDVLYATIEAEEDERGFYRSRDRGESWEQRSSYLSGGTGPHYYQEIVASPHDVDRVYQMDVFLHVTEDGGATFREVGDGRQKHSDNHALVIDPEDPLHLLAGTDGGLYESFDGGGSWRHFGNLPISQFYRLALSAEAPLHRVAGGAQDLGTLVGPVRTTEAEGIRNEHWSVPLGADGYHCAFDPEDADVLYAEWQVGRLARIDLASGEALDIQPQPAPGEGPERWNWDAPLEVSPHAPGRLWFASHRVWRSDDRGSSWEAVSGDLTGGENRYRLPFAGRLRSVDALWDNGAMSWYGTLTTLDESPRVEGLLYTGSDDGRIHASDGAGGAWRRAGELPGVPERAFVNAVHASRHDPDLVFAAVDAHMLGDYRPLLFASDDRGRTWRPISGDLPEDHVVWAVDEDPEDPRLLYAATEFGLYFTPDRGGRWIELGGGVPTIAFRDLEVHAPTDSLVGASFGRGFWALDDLSPLRALADGAAAAEAFLFEPPAAWWYVPSVPFQAPGRPSQGSADFAAPNPPFGAVLTYHLREDRPTPAERRRQREREIAGEGGDVPFPGWERLRDEALADEPRVVVTVRDAGGAAVRRLPGPAEAGIHRVAWDLRRPPADPVDLEPPGFTPPWVEPPRGPLVAPGEYTVELALLGPRGELEPLAEPCELEVVPLPVGLDPDADPAGVADFQRRTAELLRRVRGAAAELERTEERLRHLAAALFDAPAADRALFARHAEIEAGLAAVRRRLVGDPVLQRWEEPAEPSVLRRVSQIAGGHWDTRRRPTATQRESLEVARSGFAEALAELARWVDRELVAFESEVEAAGAPWTPGRALPDPVPEAPPP